MHAATDENISAVELSVDEKRIRRTEQVYSAHLQCIPTRRNTATRALLSDLCCYLWQGSRTEDIELVLSHAGAVVDQERKVLCNGVYLVPGFVALAQLLDH